MLYWSGQNSIRKKLACYSDFALARITITKSTKDPSINTFMGWETSTDTLEAVILKFPTKEKAIEYAKKNNISYKVIEPKKKEFVIKSYADNFLKN